MIIKCNTYNFNERECNEKRDNGNLGKDKRCKVQLLTSHSLMPQQRSAALASKPQFIYWAGRSMEGLRLSGSAVRATLPPALCAPALRQSRGNRKTLDLG